MPGEDDDRDLYALLSEKLGAELAAKLMMRLPSPSGEPLATKADLVAALGPYATKADLVAALEPYATKAELVSALEPYATRVDLERYATREDMNLGFAAVRSEIVDVKYQVAQQAVELGQLVGKAGRIEGRIDALFPRLVLANVVTSTALLGAITALANLLR
ncbi:hypothetical protein BH20ACT2_BH20ACT2_22210 [soil metagenome]